MIFARTFFAFTLLMSFISPTSAIELPFAKPLQAVTAPAQPKAEATYVQGKYKVAYIKFLTPVDDPAVDDFIAEIEDANKKGVDFVFVLFDSPGGSVYAGLRAAKAIEDSKATTVCATDVMAASMASFLMSTCQIRVMTKETQILVHEPSVNDLPVSGKQHAFKELYNQLHALTEAMIEHYAKHTHMAAAEIRKKIDDTDWWVNWEEAQQVGLVDGIVADIKSVLKGLSTKGKIPLVVPQPDSCH